MIEIKIECRSEDGDQGQDQGTETEIEHAIIDLPALDHDHETGENDLEAETTAAMIRERGGGAITGKGREVEIGTGGSIATEVDHARARLTEKGAKQQKDEPIVKVLVFLISLRR